MDQLKIAERVTGKLAGRGEEYRKYFDKKLKKWNVKSPSEIPDDKKDDFFEEVDKGWNSQEESGKDGKQASMVSLRDRMAKSRQSGCEKLPEGPMRDNCQKKKEEGKKEAAVDLNSIDPEVIELLQRVGVGLNDIERVKDSGNRVFVEIKEQPLDYSSLKVLLNKGLLGVFVSGISIKK